MTRVRKIEKLNETQNKELDFKPYQKTNKKETIEKPILDVEFPKCKQRNWIEFDRRFSFPNCEVFIQQKHQIDDRVLRQDKTFSTRLPYANKKFRERYISQW